MADSSKLIFSIQTLIVDDGKKLKGLKADSNGVYKGIPLIVIDQASRNHRLYESSSLLNCITGENSVPAKACREGVLEGEWGHPYIPNMACGNGVSKEALERLLMIKRDMVSHRIVNMYSKTTTDGKTVIYGDILPFGPYGKYLIESFESPVTNAAFSLRAFSKPVGTTKEGDTIMQPVAVVTFDAVGMPGYKEATKRYVDSNENLKLRVEDTSSLDISVLTPNLQQIFDDRFSTESLESTELRKLLKANEVKINTLQRFYRSDTDQLYNNGALDSKFHLMFHRGK